MNDLNLFSYMIWRYLFQLLGNQSSFDRSFLLWVGSYKWLSSLIERPPQLMDASCLGIWDRPSEVFFILVLIIADCGFALVEHGSVFGIAHRIEGSRCSEVLIVCLMSLVIIHVHGLGILSN